MAGCISSRLEVRANGHHQVVSHAKGHLQKAQGQEGTYPYAEMAPLLKILQGAGQQLGLILDDVLHFRISKLTEMSAIFLQGKTPKLRK